MTKSNILIAEFMGMQKTNIGWFDNEGVLSQTIYNLTNGNCFDNLMFHESWDWLMPVAVKCFDITEKSDLNFKLNDALLETNLDSLYEVVVEIITNHNNEE